MSDPTCVDCAPSQEPTVPQPASPLTTVQPTYDPLDPSTFVPPQSSVSPSVTIEFCDRCRWLHRATWTSTELFITFPSPALKSITIIPQNADDTTGRFRVWLTYDGEPHAVLIWDRKVEGKFPELKDLVRMMSPPP